MVTEAIAAVIGELKTLSPDINHTLVFKLDGETLASSEGTTPEQTQALIANISGITHAECIGGIESIVIQDVNTQLVVSAVGDAYLATLSSRSGDQKVIKSLTEVVVPTVIRLSLGSKPIMVEKPEPTVETVGYPVETEVLPPQEEPETPVEANVEERPEFEPFLPKAQTTQFMVEKISGFMVAADTVRIDGEVIEKWQDECDGKHFTLVNIETLEGRKVTCKFKTLKDARANAKGIIQIPERLIQALQSDKGKLVMVSPVVE
jgi:hypothetical protein